MKFFIEKQNVSRTKEGGNEMGMFEPSISADEFAKIKKEIQELESTIDPNMGEQDFSKIAQELLIITRELNKETYFLITYDLENTENNPNINTAVKEKLTNPEFHIFDNSKIRNEFRRGKKLPASTLILTIENSQKIEIEEVQFRFKEEVEKVEIEGVKAKLGNSFIVEILDGETISKNLYR